MFAYIISHFTISNKIRHYGYCGFIKIMYFVVGIVDESKKIKKIFCYTIYYSRNLNDLKKKGD